MVDHCFPQWLQLVYPIFKQKQTVKYCVGWGSTSNHLKLFGCAAPTHCRSSSGVPWVLNSDPFPFGPSSTEANMKKPTSGSTVVGCLNHFQPLQQKSPIRST